MLRSVVSTQQWVFEGYVKYSKRNTYFTIPILDRVRMMIIPQSQLRVIYGLPETVLDAVNTNATLIQSPWTIWDHKVAPNDNNILANTIRNRITKNLAVLTPQIAVELERGFRREWGHSIGQWKTIHAWDSSMNLIAGAANSAFYGLPLSTITLPEIQKRLHDAARRRDGSNYLEAPCKNPSDQEDALQWCIEESYATGDPDHLDPMRIALRLVYLNDISTHSTSFTAANVILDLASSDPSLGYIKALREESARVLKEADGSWTRQAVSELKLIDSTIRESMRMSPFNSIGVPRTVIEPHGITVQQGNSTMKLPQGTIIGVPVAPIQYDEKFYPNAKEFHPFRFAPDAMLHRDISSLHNISENPKGSVTREKASVMIDESFLHFGFGKHACPGRFFAMNEVKIFVAHMVLHYDIEHLVEGRPKLKPILWLNAPIMGNFNVRVRKRDPVELRS
ncbi:hypothetical protein FHL15_011302 [Xylaria flabelliformis]|uniref:Cytochrome P450 n=1 Tax=Xylaria flabelliformis TaxID=2512241 RepID=A0A553HIN3_9PEZI|nr:hypothetical protein FHL15_011302 [Xylaria flabelliformis]